MLLKTLRYCLFIWVCFPLLSSAQGTDDLQFVKNHGQFEEQVLFRVQLNSGFVYLERNAISFKLFDEKEYGNAHRHLHSDSNHTHPVIHGHVFRYKFYNSQKEVRINGEKPFSEKFNYFLGNDQQRWASNVPLYAEVIYTNIYPGINLRVYSKYGQIKYEWIVSPYADPAHIDIEMEGLDSLRVKGNNLLLHTSIGTFPDKDMEVWQTNPSLKLRKTSENISCHYQLKKNHITYKISSSYQKDLPLIIDPILIFSTYSGSRGDNFGYTATFDLRGNLYAGGITDNSHGEYPVTTGAFQTQCKGGKGRDPVNLACDITISKYDSSGKKLLYATYIGGVDDDYPHSMIVNGDTELVVFGTTYSKDFPMTTKGYDKSHNSITTTDTFTDIIIFKLSKNGDKLQASTFFGGNNHDGVTDKLLVYNYADEFRGEVLTDKANNIYVVSSTNSSNIPLKNASKSSLEGDADGLCLKFSKDLDQLVWSTYFGGNGSDGIYSLEFDKSENIYIAGGTLSDNLPVSSSALDKNANGGIDGFMGVFNKSSFALDKLTYYGTSTYDQIYFLEIDKEGNVYATGQTQGDITPSANVYSNKAKTGQFIVIADNSLTKIKKQTVFGSRVHNPEISPSAFLVDSCGNIYLSGWGSFIKQGRVGTTNGLPITSNAIQKTTDGSDFYLAVFGKNLSRLLFATYYGGNLSDDHVDGGTSRFDKRGVIYQSVCSSCPDVPGQTLNDFPTTNGSAFPKNVSYRCSNAAFKIDFQINNVVKAKFIPDPTLCGPAQIQFTNQSLGNGTYQWDFGDGKQSTEFNPLHSYPNVGQYTIRLIAIDSNTCNVSDTSTKLVNVLQRPTADFEVKNVPCTPKVDIINKSSDFTTASWDYGNGHKVDTLNPKSYNYPAPGVYKIRLITDVNKLCSDTLILPVYIRKASLVEAKFKVDTVLCESSEVQFTNQSVGNGRSIWNFGDGNSSSDQDPKHVYNKAGVYKAQLISIDSTLCNIRDTATKTIKVMVNSIAGFEFKTIRCTGKIEITNKSSNYTTVDWDYGDGHTDKAVNPAPYEYGSSGVYQFRLITDAKNICPDTAIATVTIGINLFVEAKFIPDSTICENLPVAFTNQSNSLTNMNWDFGDGQTSKEINPIHYFEKAGNYKVTLIVTDSVTCNISDTATRNISVIKPGIAAFDIDTFACSNRIEIKNKSEGIIQSYWDFGNGDTSVLTSPGMYQYMDSGTFTIQLITDRDQLCPDTAWVDVIIKGTPSDVLVPINVFTPDGDGLNDCFHFKGGLNECSEFKLIIYDRWGLKMFETKNFNQCWNGRVNNVEQKCPEGTYFYIVEYKGDSIEILPKFSGSITLIRK